MTNKIADAATSIPAIAASAAAAIGCTAKAVYEYQHPPLLNAICIYRADGSCEPIEASAWPVVWDILAIVFIVLTIGLCWIHWRIRHGPRCGPA